MSIPKKKAAAKKTAPKKKAPANKIAADKETALPVNIEKTTLDTLYLVDASDGMVTLEINIGDKGQTSDMTVMLGDTIIVKELAGDLLKTKLGKNKELNGKKLHIVASIADTSRESNLTSLTIHLKGGLSANDFPLSKTVDEEGESEDYLCLIEFFNPVL